MTGKELITWLEAKGFKKLDISEFTTDEDCACYRKGIYSVTIHKESVSINTGGLNCCTKLSDLSFGAESVFGKEIKDRGFISCFSGIFFFHGKEIGIRNEN